MSAEETLRHRTQEINAEYWECRESQSERVAVAQVALAYARVDAELRAARAELRVQQETFKAQLRAGTEDLRAENERLRELAVAVNALAESITVIENSPEWQRVEAALAASSTPGENG